MSRGRCLRATLLISALCALAGCSTPASGQGTVAGGRRRVAAMLQAMNAALPPGSRTADTPATGTVPCRKKFLGYSVGETGKHRVEGPLLVDLADNADPRKLLPDIENAWRRAGLTVDTSGLSDKRYPKVRATNSSGDTAIATAITDQPTRVDLYVTTRCLAD